MTAAGFPAALQLLGAELSDPEISAGASYAACERLLQLFLAASGLDISSFEARRNLALPSGKALGPAWAAHCIRDFHRTTCFLRGIRAAIAEAGRKFGAPLRLLYAGAGPFAPLVLPLLPLLNAEEKLELTLLDIHPENIENLRRLVAALSLEGRAIRCVVGDATTFQCDQPPHLLAIEMLQAGLEHEPQVEATLHLRTQLHPGGYLIPERISVEAALFDPNRNVDRMLGMAAAGEEYRMLGSVFQLSRTAPDLFPEDGKQFPEHFIALPPGREARFRQLALLTQIDVFGSERLGFWDSILTYAVPVLDLDKQSSVRAAGFRYAMGEDPGFVIRTENEE